MLEILIGLAIVGGVIWLTHFILTVMEVQNPKRKRIFIAVTIIAILWYLVVLRIFTVQV